MEQTAALRAEWFAQLADAIESAQRVAWQLGACGTTSVEARELYGRLEKVRMELDGLRRAEIRSPAEIEPGWLEMLGWGRPRLEFD
jgi:hypothetical protein